MRRVEGVPDYAALGMGRATELDFAHRQAGRTRSYDHLGRQELVELAVELPLEIDALGPVLLDEIGALHRRCEVGREGQAGLRRARREAQSLKGRPGGRDEPLERGRGVWRDIGRDDIKAFRQ